MCGIKRRLFYPEFRELVDKYDIFCALETKHDDMDEISLEGYKFIHQTRKQKFLRKSGGIVVFVRNDLCLNVE